MFFDKFFSFYLAGSKISVSFAYRKTKESITIKCIRVMETTKKPEKKEVLVKVGKGVFYFLLGLFTYYVIDCVWVDVKHAIADAIEETR